MKGHDQIGIDLGGVVTKLDELAHTHGAANGLPTLAREAFAGAQLHEYLTGEHWLGHHYSLRSDAPFPHTAWACRSENSAAVGWLWPCLLAVPWCRPRRKGVPGAKRKSWTDWASDLVRVLRCRAPLAQAKML